MKDTFRIYPYKTASQSSRVLANALNSRRIRLENSQYRYRPNHLIINWGNNSTGQPWFNREVRENTLNRPDHVYTATNKLNTHRVFQIHGIPTPDMTRSNREANKWLQEEGLIVLGRDLTRGSGGRGITVYHPDENEMVGEHRYYTRYIKKRREFRLHVGYDSFPSQGQPQVFFVQEKKRRARENRNEEQYDSRIRNYSNEWIFAHNDLEEIPSSVYQVAREALRALRLDFGAVDVIYNSYQAAAYVLEVNTACGMEGETLNRYVEHFNQFLGE